MNYDVDYFIKKFEAIPKGDFCINQRQNYLGQRCAHGHCYKKHEDPNDWVFICNASNEEIALTELASVLELRGFACINNGDNPNYQQPTPKQRILAALYDIKRMQEPKQPEVIYKVVEVDHKVKELVKEERILN